jgi:NADP-dependent alcohol dehydrogenase
MVWPTPSCNVWNIHVGDDDTRIDAAIEATCKFFHKMGMATRLSDYGLGAPDIELIVAALESHGMTALGETQAITPETARRILKATL